MSETPTTERPAMPTVRQFIDAYKEAYPMHFVIAADHPFTCVCDNCITFLATTGLDVEAFRSYAWTRLQAEQVGDAGMTDDQLRRFHVLASRYL